MPSLTAKDRIPLCLFTYEDGRRCRTPRIGTHPYFCFYHAQKESQSQSTENLPKRSPISSPATISPPMT
jgi:hypothetical protein